MMNEKTEIPVNTDGELNLLMCGIQVKNYRISYAHFIGTPPHFTYLGSQFATSSLTIASCVS